jgi:DHA2 family multidrug resistance protein-like MFS transporter
VKRVAEHGLDGAAALSIAAGLALGLVFVRRQAASDDPLIDLHLFRTAATRTSIAAMILATFVMAGMLLFVASTCSSSAGWVRSRPVCGACRP